MLTEIAFSPATGLHCWKLWDGPNGSDYRTGYCLTLGECFERIVLARAEIGRDYTAE
jgi:hypothetical protein